MKVLLKGGKAMKVLLKGGKAMKERTIQMVVSVITISFILAFAVNAIGADDENPCAADLKKFCSNIPFGEGRIADCMGKHRKEVSPTCQAHIEKVATEGFGNECRDEVMTYCPLDKRRVECLVDHAIRGGQSPYGKLSGFCYKWLMDLKKQVEPLTKE
jgi:hypothetical protein